MEDTRDSRGAAAAADKMADSLEIKSRNPSEPGYHGSSSAETTVSFGSNASSLGVKPLAFAPTLDSYQDTSSKGAPVWFPPAEAGGGPGQIYFNDPRTNICWNVGEYDRWFWQRHIDSNVPCGWHCGMPVYLVSGARCDSNQHRPCYALPPPPSTSACCSRPVDPVLVFPRPSPAPALSDCTTLSELSSNASGLYETSSEPSYTSSGHEAARSRVISPQQECGPSAQVAAYGPLLGHSYRASHAQPTYAPHTWNEQAVDANRFGTGDPSRTWNNITRESMSTCTGGGSISSREASFASAQSRSYGIVGSDNSGSQDSTSYPIAQPQPPQAMSNQVAQPTSPSEDSFSTARKASQPRKRPQNTQRPATRKSTPSKRNNRRSTAKDNFLLRSKAAGMSYKAIKAEGNFVEAESTLRGRYRTLTKTKDKRVRRPRWTDADVSLLKEAVEAHDPGNGSRRQDRGGGAAAHERAGKAVKVSWRAVAEYIEAHGGSYLFGVATCRKKWDEISRG